MQSHKAFSLVELSIVLVILGLLTGGILGGQALIRAAELRAISTEAVRWTTAVQTFRDKYFALPGDMTNATKFWGTDAGGCPGTNATATAGGVPTCDGNGDGRLTPSVATSNEMYRFWQQLANAALIEGSFTGVSNSGTASTFVGSFTTPNIPRSKVTEAGWHIFSIVGPIQSSSTTYFDGLDGNVFFFGTNGTNPSQGSVLKPEEAWNLDTKMDDGKPGVGKVSTLEVQAQPATNSASCTDTPQNSSTNIAASSAYMLSNTGKNCSLIFTAGF